MISFYPGPSRVHDALPQYVKDAAKEGIMSINHRSETFVAMSKKTIGLLKEKLNIPRNYTIFFTSSATECWEIIAQSLITDKSYHLYNGSFGQKWFDYTQRLHPGAMPIAFDTEEQLDPNKLILDQREGIICLTQNETSNGTQVDNRTIGAIKKNNPSYLVAVDATSSMAGIKLDFKSADIWFASVQKCFGLPAGLGILVCSPQAIDRAKAINERSHYNSLPFMIEMMDKWQTPFTPNVLGIYLLMRVLENCEKIATVHDETVKRYNQWKTFLSECKSVRHLVRNEAVQSYTVFPVFGDEAAVTKIKKAAKKNGFLLGEGYGTFKPQTFRIANFPAIKKSEIKSLMNFLQGY
ncbi:aminotransferase class V-fold PLP-dependent enzyme [Pseudochryseolinea flava]|uniref:Phosphoserine aminotransferase n=1 Tax=Pseudochryseolinea flava TaxID=2059302 RepID=A0A364XY03_9BACT|nr:aminotransferase class V-fold PLP-dependent enzyme [Pseudochryseolinea flava]RAV99130.1 phosphoserine aminotransferase [Pseudochryseolinea flava]